MQLSLKIAIWTSSQRLEVEYFIKTKNVDILVLQVSETHFADKSYFKINGSDLIISNYLDGMAHGGSAILIKSSPNHVVLKLISVPSIQSISLSISLQIPKVSGAIVITSLYLLPRFNITK